jgi:excisionase family DNA binding protein
MTANYTNETLPAQPPDSWIETVTAPIAAALAEQIRAQVRATPPSPYLNIQEAAEYLRCKPQRVYDLVSARVLERYKDGTRVLVRRDEIDAYLASLGPSAMARRRPPT